MGLRQRIKRRIKRRLCRDTVYLDAIAEVVQLPGQWNADTIEAVAAIVELSGRDRPDDDNLLCSDQDPAEIWSVVAGVRP